MELVIDTNIVFSAIVKNSVSRFLLLNPNVILYSPEGLISELALCLAKGIPLWSNDKPLKEQQSIVKVFPTSELFDVIERK